MNELQKLIKLAMAEHSPDLTIASASTLRGLCALAMVQLVSMVEVMREASPPHCVPRISPELANAALMLTKREDYEAAAEWLAETIMRTTKGRGDAERQDETTDP